MTEQAQTLLRLLAHRRVGLFVDNANWFYPQREEGWHISFGRLTDLLTPLCTLSVQRLYAGTPLTARDAAAFQSFSTAATAAHFTVVTKPLKKIWLDRRAGTFVYKCNFDVEIALDVARSIDDLEVALLGSGDSDFLEIKRFAREREKGFVTLCFERGIAWEMRKQYHIFLEDLRAEIERP